MEIIYEAEDVVIKDGDTVIDRISGGAVRRRKCGGALRQLGITTDWQAMQLLSKFHIASFLAHVEGSGYRYTQS